MSLHQRGFTLVELSIVLVILGLLVGGVLSGQSLIRAAELRSILTEKDKHVVALNAFRDKYLAVAGDMPNAFRFWGTDCGTDTTDTSTGCNGNGNGQVNLQVGETLKAWEHLSRAGLVEGSYDGTGSGSVFGGGLINMAETSIPKSKFPSGYWNIIHSGETAHAGNSTSSLSLQIGGLATAPNIGVLPGLTLGEALNTDTKADDGRANTGSIRGYDNSVGHCFDTGTDYYNIATYGENDAGNCILTFILR